MIGHAPPAGGVTTAPLIQFEHVFKTFVADRRSVPTLDDVNLSINADEFLAIIGPSGCGKSTLLRLLAGFTYPTAGTVYCYEQPVTAINTRVGFVSQENDLFPWMTLLHNVEYPLLARHVPSKERTERARALIDLVGLTGFESSYPHQLSGGMQKRASLIRTIIYEPAIILMDEPFGPLDAQTRLILQNELLNIWSSRHMTVLFVTHDLVEAIALSDRVVVMTKRPAHIKAIVDVPLQRPRDVFEIHDQQGFHETHHHLWQLMSSELGLQAPRAGGPPRQGSTDGGPNARQ